jgi:DNA-binding transcriptional MerR regulator|tara:strand:+ start:177 stop:872 length:696 start_codon:yes stop_codon:yes gene_type:complete
MGTIEKILNILKMKNEPKSYSVKFYAEMKLDDGRVIATEDDQFMIGSKVFAISDDGNAEALEAGSYTMENGNKLTIGENSEILDLGEEKEAEDVEASEEEMSEEVESKEEQFDEPGETPAEKADWAETYEKLKDRVAELEDKVFGKREEEETEELSKEEDVSEDKTEMSSEIIGELTTQIEELKSKIVELSGQPAEEGISYSPEGMKNANTTIDLRKLSTNERAAYYINNK